jgi:hypothetical protein
VVTALTLPYTQGKDQGADAGEAESGAALEW